MSRPLRVALIVVGIFVVLIGAALAVLESGIPRRIAQSAASAKLGRDVSIGHLEIDLVPRLRVVASDVKVANMDTGTTPNMVEIARAEAVIDATQLLTGKLDVLLVSLDRPVIVAEKDKSGNANWQFGDPDEPAAETPDIPVRRLQINQGQVTYRDPTSQIDIAMQVHSEPAAESGVERLALSGNGKIAGSDFKLQGKADTVLNLQSKEQPYAVEIEASAGEATVRIAGSLEEPMRFEGLAADLHLDARNAYDVYQLTGVTIPLTPPYSLDGKLFRDGDVWRLEPFTAQVGRSDLRGVLTFDTGGERPKLIANLTSKRIVVADFGIGGGGQKRESGTEQVQRRTKQKQAQGQTTKPLPEPSGSSTVIPDTEIEFDRLKMVDADIKFRGTRVEAPIVPVNEVATELSLDNGLLNVKPLRFRIGDGRIDFTLTLNGRQKPAAIDAVMSLTRVPVGEVLKSVERKLEQHQTSTGTLGGRAEIRGRGNSLKALLDSSNGHLGMAMQQGQIGSLFIELIGLDAAETLGVLATRNKPVPLRCFIADFELIDGTLGSKTFVIDTKDTSIIGEGAVNFDTEQVTFRLVPHPKDVSPFAARTPIDISGKLNDIKVRPEAGRLAARAGIAAALSAILTPLAAPLAFIDVGLGKDSDCAAFVQEVRSRIEREKREGSPSGGPGNAAAPKRQAR